MAKMTKKMAKEIMLSAADAAADLFEKNGYCCAHITDIYDRAYEMCGVKEEDFLPASVKESYWYQQLGRTLSPICILAVQEHLEKKGEDSIGENFTPCAFCPYADKRMEAEWYDCRPEFVLTRRFTHYNQTSLGDLDELLRIVSYRDSLAAREARGLVEKIFREEIRKSAVGKWNRSVLLSG